jgi:YidC/Oxa1 family membrane protein insertase
MDQKNLLGAVALSILILGGYHYFFERPALQARTTAQTTALTQQPTAATSTSNTPDVMPRAEALAAGSRIPIETPNLKGSINLTGGAIDDLVLVNYKTTQSKDAPSVVLFSPSGSTDAYYGNFGWSSADKSIDLPNTTTVWTTDRNSKLTPNSPVILRWKNRQGLEFEKVVSIDDQYMLTVTQKVRSRHDQAIDLHAYGLISRHGTPKTAGFFIMHEGPLGVFDGKLEELDYKKLQEKSLIQNPTAGGWIGITDKYWLAALVPDQNLRVETSFKYLASSNNYQADFVQAPQRLLPDQEISATHRLFAGAKVLNVLDHYTNNLGVQKLDLAIDFGWFYFLTKPLFYVLTFLYTLLGNFGVALIVLTILAKLLFFPLANRSYRAMALIRRLQPEIERLQQRYADDKMKLNQEMMQLYQKQKVNPLSGCLPMLLQFPVFFALYKVLFISIEMRHAPFFGWIHDLSAPDPTSLFNLFGLIPWSPPDFLQIGLWPLIMGVTMLIQQRMNPQPADPMQAKMFMILPIMFTVMLAQFPVGLVIYWAVSNVLSIAQQWFITRLATPESAAAR